MPAAVYLAGLLKVNGAAVTRCAMRILGPILIIALIGLVSMVTYAYFILFLPKLSYIYGPTSCLLITCYALILVYCIFFNYIMSIIRGPGLPPNSPNFPRCNKCKDYKPLRAHHCSICNRCVLKMDHHCPWINNCVGHQNHRYFLLFLFYLTLGCYFIAIFGLPAIINREPGRRGLLFVSYTLSVVFAIVLTGFGGWHWYLAFKGHTTIELCALLTSETDRSRYNFSRGSYLSNLEVIFGTRSLWGILAPRCEKLPFDGMHWPDTLASV